MKVRDDDAYQRFLSVPSQDSWTGIRIKRVRHQPLHPGGRARLTLFEKISEDGRPHPRMQVEMPPAEDPNPPGDLFTPDSPATSADGLREQIDSALRRHQDILQGDDLDIDDAPGGSPMYWRNSIRVQRIAALFDSVRAKVDTWLGEGTLPAGERNACQLAICELEDDAYAGRVEFDDADTGTYHSYGHDQPFVHYLETLIESLPAEGGRGFAVLDAEAQHSLRRQRQQLFAHLDFLMRHKYANEVIVETDIERTLGGFLIDRESRRIVSEVPDMGSLVPRFELLRIAPGADHEYAGEWVYRTGEGGYCLQDGTEIEVDEALLRSSPRQAADLTFRRAPNHPKLRPGIRFDWDGNGWVKAGKIDWVSWAGHCDIKAIMEQLGITLTDEPSVTEYRSDSGDTTFYSRALLTEMVASVMELGSVYRRADGTGRLQRGIHRFGGARNDSRPDRIQFEGFGQGRHFRWPLTGRQEAFRITSIAWPNAHGKLERADMGTVYYRKIPDVEAVDFATNPRFLKTVEGDYNLIDISGSVLTAALLVDDFDADTGYPGQRRETTLIDLRPEPEEMRSFLGTHIDDVAARRLYRVYLDREKNRIEAELFVYEQDGGKWRPRKLESETFVLGLKTPLRCNASHEMKRDNPVQHRALVDIAIRQAQNICADTDKAAAVWNGVVTMLDVQRRGENRERRIQHWSVGVKARFGSATVEFLVQRDESGRPVEYCPALAEDSYEHWPDFLWQDFPDVGSKGIENGEWIINDTMLERNLISFRTEPSAPGGFYVYDDHIKNVFELIYTGLAGYCHTIVHGNKRYGFESESEWEAAVAELERRRAELTFD